MDKKKDDREEGFYVNESFEIKDVAYLSLGIALKAYASTFRDIKSEISLLCDIKEPQSNNAIYNSRYIEHFCEAITHFQHFSELYIKGILQKIHPLLVVDAGRDHTLLYELLMEGEYDKNKLDSLKQIEFSVALDRICELIKNKKIDDRYKFIYESKSNFKKVNKLRNRIAHKGIYILYYEELDKLFGNFVLPFIDNVLNIESKNKEFFFKKTRTGLTPYNEIIECFKSEKYKYDIKTIGVLKEIARAIYEDKITPYLIFGSYYDDKIKNTEANSVFIKEKSFGDKEIETCPVCGLKTLLLEWEFFGDQDEDGNYIGDCGYSVCEIKCINCTFQLKDPVRNVKIKDLDLTKYFKIK